MNDNWMTPSPVYNAFENAWKRYQEKGWDKLYVLVDVHGVLMEPDYTKPSVRIYPECIEPMRRMSSDSRFKLIMWTCSRKEDIEKYLKMFETLDIHFDWVNANEDVQHTDALGDYSAKIYANVILDDKAGFARAHWVDIHTFLNHVGVDE